MSPRNLFSIRWTESAWKDLDDISDYLLGEGMPFDAAAEYVKRIFKAPEHLAAFPYSQVVFVGLRFLQRVFLVEGTILRPSPTGAIPLNFDPPLQGEIKGGPVSAGLTA